MLLPRSRSTKLVSVESASGIVPTIMLPCKSTTESEDWFAAKHGGIDPVKPYVPWKRSLTSSGRLQMEWGRLPLRLMV